jgi:hypothetical protein
MALPIENETDQHIRWLHSGGNFNKEPENDLGNYPSQFDVAGFPNVMNNLFDDIMPEEAASGLIDYRCIYVWNPRVTEAVECINLNLDQCYPTCDPLIEYGSKFLNDIQVVQICCSATGSLSPEPDYGGYVIFDTEWGAPFTVYWYDSCQFGADLQARLTEIPWCGSVTVIGCNPYTVEFKNDGSGCGVGNRNVQLMRVVQNHLHLKGLCRYNSVTYYGCEQWNGFGDYQVKVVQEISSYVPPFGTLRIYNPLTGLWDSYTYDTRDNYNFYLTNPLLFNLVGFRGTCQNFVIGDPDDPQNWQRDAPSPVWDAPLSVPWGVVEAPCDDKLCHVNIYKQQTGHPINNIAKPILDDYLAPEVTPPSWTIGPLLVGNLRPTEGFYLWVKRTTPPGAGPCLQDYFNLTVNGTGVSWPLGAG